MFPQNEIPMSYDDFSNIIMMALPQIREWERKLSYKYYVASCNNDVKEMERIFNDMVYNIQFFSQGRMN